MKRLPLLLLLCASLALGQSTYSSQQHGFWVGTVPTSTATVVAGTVYVTHASFSTASGSGTITLSDRSAACTGSADCDFLKAVAIAANTTYEVDFNEQIAPNGLKILATGTVTGHIHWKTLIK